MSPRQRDGSNRATRGEQLEIRWSTLIWARSVPDLRPSAPRCADETFRAQMIVEPARPPLGDGETRSARDGIDGAMDASPTDADLLAASDTDAHAFRQLYDRHARTIHRYFARRVAADAAFGLVSETFAAAWLSRHRFEDRRGGDAGPWLAGIARHVLLRTLRAGRQHQRARERLDLLRADELVVPRPSRPMSTRRRPKRWPPWPDCRRDSGTPCCCGSSTAVTTRKWPPDSTARRSRPAFRVSRGLDTIRGQLNGERHG